MTLSSSKNDYYTFFMLYYGFITIIMPYDFMNVLNL